jgi:hypothetical protein
MESLLAENFIITVEDGSTFSKSGYIAHNGDSTLHVEITEMSGLNVRMHGNVAVVTGAYHEKGRAGGKPYEYRDRFTDVWASDRFALQHSVQPVAGSRCSAPCGHGRRALIE